jgi:hypothetical protein
VSLFGPGFPGFGPCFTEQNCQIGRIGVFPPKFQSCQIESGQISKLVKLETGQIESGQIPDWSKRERERAERERERERAERERTPNRVSFF